MEQGAPFEITKLELGLQIVNESLIFNLLNSTCDPNRINEHNLELAKLLGRPSILIRWNIVIVALVCVCLEREQSPTITDQRDKPYQSFHSLANDHGVWTSLLVGRNRSIPNRECTAQQSNKRLCVSWSGC